MLHCNKLLKGQNLLLGKTCYSERTVYCILVMTRMPKKNTEKVAVKQKQKVIIQLTILIQKYA